MWLSCHCELRHTTTRVRTFEGRDVQLANFTELHTEAALVPALDDTTNTRL